MAGELKGKQRRFADEYLVDCNATRAYKAAGYTAKNDNSAASGASTLLRKPKVAAYIGAKQDKLAEKFDITKERVLRELALLGFSDVTHYSADDAGHISAAEGSPEGAMRAVSSIKRRINMDGDGNTVVDTELKLWSKPEALKILAAHVGIATDRKEVEISDLAGALSKALARVRAAR